MKKPFSHLVISCALLTFFAHPPAAESQPPALSLRSATEKNSTSIPFNPANDLVVISATINGKGPFSFLLDTGASDHVMTPELARAVGLKVKGGGAIDAGGSGIVSAGTVEVSELQIGEFTLKRQTFFVTTFPRLTRFKGSSARICSSGSWSG